MRSHYSDQAAAWTIDESAFDSPQVSEILPFLTGARPLVRTQPANQGLRVHVRGDSGRRVKLTT